MYRYDEFDATLVKERVDQFRNQVERRLTGALNRRAIQAIAIDERALFAIACLYAAGGNTLWHDVVKAIAQAGLCRAQI